MGVTNYILYNLIHWTIYENVTEGYADRSDLENSLAGAAIGSVLFYYTPLIFSYFFFCVEELKEYLKKPLLTVLAP